mgnify:CR=1 FL=1
MSNKVVVNTLEARELLAVPVAGGFVFRYAHHANRFFVDMSKSLPNYVSFKTLTIKSDDLKTYADKIFPNRGFKVINKQEFLA